MKEGCNKHYLHKAYHTFNPTNAFGSGYEGFTENRHVGYRGEGCKSTIALCELRLTGYHIRRLGAAVG